MSREAIFPIRRKKWVTVTIVLFILIGFSFAEPTIPQFSAPVLITTAGQSIDFETVHVVCNRLKIPNDAANGAKPADLKGAKTLVVVPGHSNKGLGSAGTNVAQEMERVKMLLAAAAKNNIPVILIHLGGEVRRGADSDPFINQVMTYAKCAVVWAPGNSDQFFTKKCAEKKMPLVVIDKLSDVSGILKSLFPIK